MLQSTVDNRQAYQKEETRTLKAKKNKKQTKEKKIKKKKEQAEKNQLTLKITSNNKQPNV